MKKLMIACFLLLSACAKNDGGESSSSSSSRAPKDLFSVWISPEYGLDLRNASFDPSPVTIYTTETSGCNCQVDLTGNQTNGAGTISACSGFGGENGCWAFEGNIGYTNRDGFLMVCNSGGLCTEYQ